MVGYSDIQSELNAQWNVGVIAKPTFEEGVMTNTPKYPNVLYISIQDGAKIEYSVLNGSLEKRTTPFLITIYANDLADINKFIGETRRIVNAKTISGGWWHVDAIPKYYRVLKAYVVSLFCNEKLMIPASSWS